MRCRLPLDGAYKVLQAAAAGDITMKQEELIREVHAIAEQLRADGKAPPRTSDPNADWAMATWSYIHANRPDLKQHFQQYYRGRDPYQSLKGWMPVWVR